MNARKLIDSLIVEADKPAVSVRESFRLSGGTRSLAWQELPNGDLEIKVDDETREEIRERMESGEISEVDILDIGGTSCMIGNGFEVVRPEEIGALTNALIIAYDAPRDDEGVIHPDDSTKVWWDPNYQVRSLLQELVDKGEFIFKSARS